MNGAPDAPTDTEVRRVAAWLAKQFPWAGRSQLISIAGEAFTRARKTYKPEKRVPFGWWWKQVAYWTAIKDHEVCELDTRTVRLLELMAEVELARQGKGEPRLDDDELVAGVKELAAERGLELVVTPDEVSDARLARGQQRPEELDEELVPSPKREQRGLQEAAELDQLMLKEVVPFLKNVAKGLHQRANGRPSGLRGTAQALRDRASAQDLELTLKHLQDTPLMSDEAGYLAVALAVLRLVVTHDESRKALRPQAITSFIYDHLDHDEIVHWGLKLVRNLSHYERALAPLSPVRRTIIVLRLAGMAFSTSASVFAPPITIRTGAIIDGPQSPPRTVAITIEVLTGPVNQPRTVANATVEMFDRPSEALADADDSSRRRAAIYEGVTNSEGNVTFAAEQAHCYHVIVSKDPADPGAEFAVPAWGKLWEITVYLQPPRPADKSEGIKALEDAARKNEAAATELDDVAVQFEQEGKVKAAALARKETTDLRALAGAQREIAEAAHTRAAEKQQRRRSNEAEEGINDKHP